MAKIIHFNHKITLQKQMTLFKEICSICVEMNRTGGVSIGLGVNWISPKGELLAHLFQAEKLLAE